MGRGLKVWRVPEWVAGLAGCLWGWSRAHCALFWGTSWCLAQFSSSCSPVPQTPFLPFPLLLQPLTPKKQRDPAGGGPGHRAARSPPL